MPKTTSFLDKLRKQIAESGQSKKGFWFVKDANKRRIRFIRGSDLEQAVTIIWHSKWVGQQAEVDSPCLKQYDKDCPFCGVEGVNTREKHCWTVYDYEAGERQIFMYPANRNSPVAHLAANYEEWNTLCDRDIVVKRTGKGTDTVYSIIGNAPSKFRVEGIKALSEAKILELVWKAFGQGSLDDYEDLDESADDDEEEEEYDEEEEETEEETEDDEEYDDEEETELPVKAKKKTVAKKVAEPAKKTAGRRRS